MEEIINEKVAIVTGGSFGIGRATALAFARRRIKIALADCVEDKETLDLIRALNGEVIFIPCDVSSDNDVRKMTEKVIDEFGRIDYAFNNAGMEGLSAPTHECTEDNWNRVVDVNLKGVWLCMKYQIPHMLRIGKGSIVNNASVAGLVGFQNIPAYVASKHGIVGLTKNAALEYARAGIRVNTICPGVIQTPMIDRFTGKNKEVEKKFAEQEPIGRLGLPDEVAAAVMWLCSDDSSFVTGAAIPVDGGWIAQ